MADIQPTLENAEGSTTGTDAPIRTTVQTQATGTGYNGDGYAVGIDVRAEDGALSSLKKNPETGELYDPAGTANGVELTTSPGNPTNDDSGKKSTTNTQTDVNAANNSVLKVEPQPNILDQFYSYTYSASVYLMTPEQYIRILSGESRKVDGYQLLFQSAGAPVTPGRNPFFPNDYYIDSITLETIPLGKGTGAAHTTSSLKFTVSEPNGITLLDNLYKAVQNFAPKDGAGAINYTAAIYMMAIRFYGYDQEGNIQNPIRGGLETAQATGDSKAVVEKFIPFNIAKINWSVGTKLVSYEWECVPIGQLQAGYTQRGTIPYDIQLADSTVGGLLGNQTVFVGDNDTARNQSSAETQRLLGRTTPQVTALGSEFGTDATFAAAPAKADAAATVKKTITQGLMGAMNDFQSQLVAKGTFDVPDEYFIKFVDGFNVKGTDISGATIALPNKKVDHAGTASAPPATTDAEALDPTKQYADMISRSFSITAGQQLLQAIELAIRNSSYVLSQANIVKNDDGTEEMKNDTKKQFNWFTILMEARPGKYDYKRNDHAYQMTYTVAPYIPKNVNSIYFPISRFSGVHKSYPFWFTGKNTAVKEYQENLNSLYTLTVSGSTPENSAARKTAKAYTSSMQEIPKYAYASASGESRSGAKGAELEAASNAAEVLYDPGSMAEAKVKIIGDPAWIMQGSLFKSIKAGTFSNNTVRSGFESDGSISFDSQDVLFEMAWQRPEDYDLNTGLADPYSGGYSGNANKNRQPLQSRVYICTKVVSEFKGGSFEQQLTGTLYMFPKPDKKNTADPSVTDQTDAETGRTGVNLAGRVQNNAFTDPRTAGRVQNNASTDPRSLLSPDGNSVTDGSTAAILGANSNRGGAMQAINTNLPSTVNGVVTSEIAITNTNLIIQPAGSPDPPSDGQGNQIGLISSTIIQGPPKLPGVQAGQNSLSTEQRAAQIVQAEARITERQARRESAAAGTPVSTSIPNNQQISKDY